MKLQANGVWYCLGKNDSPNTDGVCGESGPMCSSCAKSILNKAGFRMYLGKKTGATTYYCERTIGASLGSADGVCGPWTGPNCKDCKWAMTNYAGFPMKTGSTLKNYCGRKLGAAKIPGSDGQCGWNNGPQCWDCTVAPIPFILN